MYHDIKNNIYRIYDENSNVIFSCQLDNTLPGDQVIISVNDEVYAGPIKFMKFKEE